MKTRKLEILFLTGFSSTKMFVNSKNLRQWKSGFHSSEKVDSLHIKLCISPWRNKIKSRHLHWNFWILQFLHDTYKFTCQLTIRVMSLFWVDNNMKISIFPVLDIPEKPVITEPLIIWRIFHKNLMEMQSSSFLY